MIGSIDLTKSFNNGKLRYSGSYNMNGIVFLYSMNQQKKGEYIMRGSVRMINSLGKVQQVDREKGQPSNPRDIYCKTTDSKDVKATIIDAIEELYSNYGLKVNKLQDITNASFLTAVKSAGILFLTQNGRSLAEKTINRKYKELIDFSSKFEPLSIKQIKQADIRRICKHLEGISVSYILKMSRDFYMFCAVRHMFYGENIFAIYLENYNPKTPMNSSEQRKIAFHKKSIDDNEAEILNKEISEANALDCRYTALLLTMHCGIGTSEFMNMSYKDFIFDELFIGSCQIQYFKSFVASPISNYTKPTSAFAAIELRRRCDAVKDYYGTLDIKLTEKETGKNATVSEIRQFLKQRIRFITGLDDKEIQSLATIDEKSGASKLLLDHYKFMLTEYCQLERSSAVFKFLCGNSLREDTTNSNYRSFSDKEGQKFLATILGRIPCKRLPNEYGLIENYKDYDLIFRSNDNTRLTSADYIEIRLQPGETIELFSTTGFGFNVEIKKDKFTKQHIDGQTTINGFWNDE